MVVMESGKVILVSDSQQKKASSSIVVTVSEITIEVMLLERNALEPIEVTVSCIDAEKGVVQRKNAKGGIDVR